VRSGAKRHRFKMYRSLGELDAWGQPKADAVATDAVDDVWHWAELLGTEVAESGGAIRGERAGRFATTGYLIQFRHYLAALKPEMYLVDEAGATYQVEGAWDPTGRQTETHVRAQLLTSSE
jgi:hypothetical protein